MPTDAVSLLTQLKGNDADGRAAAASELIKLGEAAQPIAVELVKLLLGADDTVREAITSALEDMGPPRPEDIEPLSHLLSRPDGDVAYWAATLLGRLEGAAATATSELKEVAKNHPVDVVRKRATWALGKIASGD